MPAKTDILENLGETALLLPQLINEALTADDRVKYWLTLFQSARDHADHPGMEAPSRVNVRQPAWAMRRWMRSWQYTPLLVRGPDVSRGRCNYDRRRTRQRVRRPYARRGRETGRSPGHGRAVASAGLVLDCTHHRAASELPRPAPIRRVRLTLPCLTLLVKLVKSCSARSQSSSGSPGRPSLWR
jgi:hypothetical protein